MTLNHNLIDLFGKMYELWNYHYSMFCVNNYSCSMFLNVWLSRRYYTTRQTKALHGNSLLWNCPKDISTIITDMIDWIHFYILYVPHVPFHFYCCMSMTVQPGIEYWKPICSPQVLHLVNMDSSLNGWLDLQYIHTNINAWSRSRNHVFAELD